MAKILFLHLPKTAGTSLRHALKKPMEQRQSPHVNACFLQKNDLELLNRFTFICGHLSLSDAHRLFPDAAIMTVVRNPIERCLSWYWYARSTSIDRVADAEFLDVQAAKQFDLETFFSLPSAEVFHNIHNRMTSNLAVMHVTATSISKPHTNKHKRPLNNASGSAVKIISTMTYSDSAVYFQSFNVNQYPEAM